jgi:hypothetical protein
MKNAMKIIPGTYLTFRDQREHLLNITIAIHNLIDRDVKYLVLRNMFREFHDCHQGNSYCLDNNFKRQLF